MYKNFSSVRVASARRHELMLPHYDTACGDPPRDCDGLLINLIGDFLLAIFLLVIDIVDSCILVLLIL